MLKTDTRYRNRGYGCLLVDTAVKEAVRLGLIPLVHIEDDNSLSQKFMLKLGFHKGEQADWIEHIFEKKQGNPCPF